MRKKSPINPSLLSSANAQHTHEVITAANIEWQADKQGNIVPVSNLFSDVYYSLADGLAESRYVFIEQNKLPKRFSILFDENLSNVNQIPTDSLKTPIPQMTIAELGFGTGLNMLVTWQLWRTIKKEWRCHRTNQPIKNSHPITPRLHLISTEKFPLTHSDLSQALASWQQRDPSLTPLIEQLLSLYPPLIAGCHRLHLDPDVTLDLWFGDAASNLAKLNLNATASVDAWYLDGFAPSCNESLWATDIFTQMGRLSKPKTTFATYSCAGRVKRGLNEAGFAIKKVKGFADKREMLIGTFQELPTLPANDDKLTDDDSVKKICFEKDTFENDNFEIKTLENKTLDNQIFDDPMADNHIVKKNTLKPEQPLSDTTHHSYINHHPYVQISVIGAGVSGLMAAWSLANRGIQVTIFDKVAPLAGASGNPRGLLSLKMTPLTHVSEHLHSISYLYSQRLYRQMDTTSLTKLGDKNSVKLNNVASIFENTGTLDLLLKANVEADKIAEYPDEMAVVLSSITAQEISGLKHQDLQNNLYLPQSGLVNPRALADKVLKHPNISFQQANVNQIITQTNPKPSVQLLMQTQTTKTNDAVVTDEPIESVVTDAVIIAAAYHSTNLDDRIFDFRKIRGQLSWFEPNEQQIQALPKLPLKYNGYCALFKPQQNDDRVNPVTPHKPTFMLGASFVRNETSTDIRASEHQVSLDKLTAAIPEMQNVLSTHPKKGGDKPIKENFSGWHARAAIRAQTPDYHPLVGQVDEQGLIWTLSGMGSKGFAFAPLCAEVLADQMTGQIPPLSTALLARLNPKRKTLQTPLER